MEDVLRAAEAALPLDFETWPKPARWFLRTITNLPTWKAHGFALCTDEQLAEWRQADTRTIRRMRLEAAKRGEVARVFVRRGSKLPDGERVRRGLWILVAGEAYRARLAGLDQVQAPSPLPALDQADKPTGAFVPRIRSDCPRQADSLSADRSLDRFDDKKLNAPAPTTTRLPELEPPAERSTSFHSGGETRNPEDEATDERAAHAIASHYAKATGRHWHRGVDAPVLAFVLRFVREMAGSEAGKVQRACAVIDRVVAEAERKGATKPPALAYVFHEQIFWLRLERLARPERSSRTPAPAPATSPKPIARTRDPREDDPAAIRALCRESLGLPPDGTRAERAA